ISSLSGVLLEVCRFFFLLARGRGCRAVFWSVSRFVTALSPGTDDIPENAVFYTHAVRAGVVFYSMDHPQRKYDRCACVCCGWPVPPLLPRPAMMQLVRRRRPPVAGSAAPPVPNPQVPGTDLLWTPDFARLRQRAATLR